VFAWLKLEAELCRYINVKPMNKKSSIRDTLNTEARLKIFPNQDGKPRVTGMIATTQ
jgi:hypothetical protein